MNRKNSGNGYSIHQPQGNKKYGTEKSGFLLKKSDGCVKELVTVFKYQVTIRYNTSIVLEWKTPGDKDTTCWEVEK